MKVSNDLWGKMLPAINGIDGGCEYCIRSFLGTLIESLELTPEHLRQVSINGAPMTDKNIIAIMNRTPQEDH